MTKGISSSLGIDPREVVSPTFTLMNQYEYSTSAGNGNITSHLIHFDCYRFADYTGKEIKSGETGLIFPEIDEWIDEAIVVVEWAQYLHSSYFSLPNSIRINLEIRSPHSRHITIESALNHL
jgi:tRNA A37 threonylcarbamoyladenosine biosynthesis protein TsaE